MKRWWVSSLAAVGAALLLAAPALANTSITVSGGACSGGGTLFCFAPESAVGTTGSAVAWTNQSGAAHTVTVCTAAACPGAPANTGTDSFDLSLGSGPGSAVQFTFASAGTYHYYCKIHGYAAMHGAVAITAASTPPPTPAPGSSPTARPSGVKGAGTTTPGTGAELSLPLLLLPLGLVLILLGLAGRRKR